MHQGAALSRRIVATGHHLPANPIIDACSKWPKENKQHKEGRELRTIYTHQGTEGMKVSHSLPKPFVARRV